MRVSSLSVLLGLVAFGHFAACSAGGDGSASGGGGNGTGGSSASGGSAGTASGGTNAGGTAGSAVGGGAGTASGGIGGTGGSATGGGGGVTDSGIPDVTFTYDGPVEQDGAVGDACAATTVKAEPAPLDMYIMFDNSTSMGTDCNLGDTTTASKWCYSINALDSFFKSVAPGNGVALQYFPKCWKSQAECSTGASCAVAEVALGQLPGNLTALEASLNGALPNGTTPTEAALRGLVSYTTANKQAGRTMIGILITDGVPEACDTNVNTLAGIVQMHLQNDKIKTFVIGMSGADYSKLEAIAGPGGASAHTANCGGTSPCFSYDVGNGNAAAFTAVLQAIQQSAVSCQYNMPTTDAGIVDPTKVEVQYSVGGNPPAQKLPHVNDANSCGSGGWYYDSNSSPKVIYLCPSTCGVVQVDNKAKIDISLGCLGS